MTGGSRESLARPEALAPHHDLDPFDFGIAALDEWLKRRARRNEADGASRTFVISGGSRTVGYYSLAASSIVHEQASGKVRRNMPNPVPASCSGVLPLIERGTATAWAATCFQTPSCALSARPT